MKVSRLWLEALLRRCGCCGRRQARRRSGGAAGFGALSEHYFFLMNGSRPRSGMENFDGLASFSWPRTDCTSIVIASAALDFGETSISIWPLLAAVPKI